MNDGKLILIEGTIVKKGGFASMATPIEFKTMIKNEFAVSTFTDKKLAKKLARAEAMSGKDIRYDEKMNLVVQRYKNKNKKEIAKIIGKELKKAGGEFIVK